MGWDRIQHKPVDVKLFMDKEMGNNLLASSKVGNEYYAAVKANNSDDVFAVVAILDGKKGFGYKLLEETMGPYYHNCPNKILKLLTPTDNESALTWRKICQRINAQKKLANSLKDGTVIKFDSPLTFTGYGSDDTFAVFKDGSKVRFRAKHISLFCRITNWKTRPFTVIHKVS
jgi:hypothetical protein